MQYEVSMTVYLGLVYIFTPDMKFLCLIMWPGKLYTDNDDVDNNVDNNVDGQNMIVRLFG